MENIYVQFDGMVYQQIVGIPMGTNCAPLIADLFLYCYERDFMSNLQKSKRRISGVAMKVWVRAYTQLRLIYIFYCEKEYCMT